MAIAATLKFVMTFLSINSELVQELTLYRPFADKCHANDGVCEDGWPLVPRATGLFQKQTLLAK